MARKFAHGIDIIEIARVRKVLDRHGERFLRRVYTEDEVRHCRGRVPELAARFAAKEAVMKALGTGVRGVGWSDIEILPNRRGKAAGVPLPAGSGAGGAHRAARTRHQPDALEGVRHGLRGRRTSPHRGGRHTPHGRESAKARPRGGTTLNFVARLVAVIDRVELRTGREALQ